MLMEAYIVSEVPNSNGYEWNVYIPELYGLPDDAAEKHLFDKYSQQSKVTTDSQDAKNDLVSVFLRSFRKVQQLETITLSDEQKRFCVTARVVGIPNSRIRYFPGNVVIVGFQSNDMMKPLILGQLLSIKEANNAKMSIALDTVTVSEKAVLPVTDTSYRVPGGVSLLSPSELNTYDATDVARVVQFLRQLEENNISVTTFVNLITDFTRLTETVSKLFPTPQGDSK